MHTDTFSFEVENEGKKYTVWAQKNMVPSDYFTGEEKYPWFDLHIHSDIDVNRVFIFRKSKEEGYKFNDAHYPSNILHLEQKISDKIISSIHNL